MASTYLTRATADFGTATNRKKCTISFWVKRSLTASQQAVMGAETTPLGGSNEARIVLRGDDTLEFYDWQSAYKFRYITNRVFRDTSAWYHIVLAIDTTHPTGSQRIKMYINGVEETSFGTSTDPAQNLDTFLNSGAYIQIGRQSTGNSYLDGSLSHYHFIDGTAYDASYFGETDATTGEWKIKTSPSVTYGTNGFFILKDGNSVTDQSGNSNNFTVGGGLLTKTEDNPSNVFNILNPLYLSASKWNFIQGHLRANGWVSGATQAWRSAYGTIGSSSGKYYFEVKCDNMYTSDSGNIAIGIVSDDQVIQLEDSGKFFNFTKGYAYAGNGLKLNNVVSIAGGDSYGNTFTINDIIGCAFDLDNHKIYWSKNGVWQNSGDPTSGATGTGSAFDLTSNTTYLPVLANYYNDDRWSCNFGNGYFGATAVASAGTNASGNGIFEYDVPTGYTALSTKGLNL